MKHRKASRSNRRKEYKNQILQQHDAIGINSQWESSHVVRGPNVGNGWGCRPYGRHKNKSALTLLLLVPDNLN